MLCTPISHRHSLDSFWLREGEYQYFKHFCFSVGTCYCYIVIFSRIVTIDRSSVTNNGKLVFFEFKVRPRSYFSVVISFHDINDLALDCSNSSAYALELLQACTKPSVCNIMFADHVILEAVHLQFFVTGDCRDRWLLTHQGLDK